MRIDIISCLPELIESNFEHSILKRARQKRILEINLVDLRKFGKGKYRQIDDYPYGGGAGMVLMIEPMVKCIESLCSERHYDELIYLTPDGERLEQKRLNQLSLASNLLLIAGHYKGIDQRIRDHFVTLEISIGDYVLSGGELASAVLADGIARLIPGVMNDETSALSDSFQDNLLSPPIYTRPAEFRNWKVPEVLLSGHEKKIEEWRTEKSFQKTKRLRPDLLD